MTDAQKLIIIRAKARLFFLRNPELSCPVFMHFDESNKGKTLGAS